jgi:MFS transporter, PPP family, 3-phenylpropionic acid transporter
LTLPTPRSASASLGGGAVHEVTSAGAASTAGPSQGASAPLGGSAVHEVTSVGAVIITTRQLAPFAALSATYFAHIGFFNPFLSLWLKELGLSLLAISLLTSVQAATRLFAPYAWGALSDHTGERVKLLRWGGSLALLASMGLFFDGGRWWLACVLFVLFTNTSAMMPMSEAAMAHLVSHGGSMDLKRYGRVRLWGSLGFLVAVFFAGAWFEANGMRHFPLWTVLTIALVCLSAWWMPDYKEAPHSQEQKLSVLPILQQSAVRWFFITLFFHVLAHIGIYAFFSLYCDALGYSKTTIGLLWGWSVVVEIVWFFTQSRWLPRLSLTAWLVVCSGVAALRFGMTASLASSLMLLFLAQTLHAITFATHHTVCIALVSHHFPGRLRGRGQALYTVIGYGFTGVLGGVAGGYLSTTLGLVSVYWAAMGISAVATACAFKVWRLQHPREVSQTG